MPVRSDEGFRNSTYFSHITADYYVPTLTLGLGPISCQWILRLRLRLHADWKELHFKWEESFSKQFILFFAVSQIAFWVNDFAVSIKKFKFAILAEWLPCPKLLFQPFSKKLKIPSPSGRRCPSGRMRGLENTHFRPSSTQPCSR